MKVVFVGASRFGLRCLDTARQLPGIDIVGIITNEQRFSISYAPEGVSNVLHADFSAYAETHGIPVYVMKNKMTEPDLVRNARTWGPELFLVVGWYHIVPRLLLTISTAVGLHASLLPDYGGGAPLVWAMINGEKKTGITFFEFSEGIDDGPIIGQKAVDISADDTIATLYEKIEIIGLDLIKEHLPRFADGTVVLTPQDDENRRIFPQRTPEDGKIDWSQTAQMIHDFIRAQTRPYPGSFTTFGTSRLKIWKSRLVSTNAESSRSAGSFYLSDDNELLVTCGMQTVIALDVVGLESQDMAAETWFNDVAKQVEGLFV